MIWEQNTWKLTIWKLVIELDENLLKALQKFVLIGYKVPVFETQIPLLNPDNLLLEQHWHKLYSTGLHQKFSPSSGMTHVFFSSPFLSLLRDVTCAPKPRCHASYMMAFSCYKTRLSSKGACWVLTYFEALDPPSCLPFGAHCVMDGVTGRAASAHTPPRPPIQSALWLPILCSTDR